MSGNDEILKRLRQIFWELFAIPAEFVQSNSDMESMQNWDSLRQMSLLSEVEKRFDVKFKLQELKELNSVSGIIKLLGERKVK